MNKFFKNINGDSLIITLLIIVAILGVVFFLRVTMSSNANSQSTSGTQSKQATTTSREAELFNLKYKSYEGPIQMGSLVRSMVVMVKKSNAEDEHQISIIFNGKEYKGTDVQNIIDNITNTSSYKIEITNYDNEGFLTTITITDSGI